MATEMLPPPPQSSPVSSATPLPQAVDYIEAQLQRTRQQVKTNDLAAALALWLVGFVAALFVLILCDHWLSPFSKFGRWSAWFMLLAGSGYYFARYIWPLLFGRINQVYAAKVIEDAQPGLKNSLLNFLLLRRADEKLPSFVVEALGQRAALDLARVPAENVVDHAPLIRLGYVLCGLMILLTAYKFLSPKDPFRSLARVVAPWSEIARASRVLILDIQPGHAEKVQGETLEVTVDVEGLRGTEQVVLHYTTADGQLVDQPVSLTSVSTTRYRCQLPAGEQASQGLRQDLAYHITAGDALSPEYQVRVLPAPRIQVEQIEIHFPAYTRRPTETVRKQGDIKALEGSRIQLQAQANFPIASAALEFDPDLANAAPARRRPASLDLQVNESTATGEFWLHRLPDGTPRFSSYRLVFTTKDGKHNDQPTLHRVEVIADLPPEIDVLKPNERRVKLPLDGQLDIELRARDPDFGLCRIDLEMEANKRPLAPVSLFSDAQGATGPINRHYELRPAKLNLAAGDELVLVGVASDNRHDSAGKLAANTQRTDRYVIEITEPERTASSAENNASQSSENKPNEKTNTGENSAEKKDPSKQPPDKNEQKPPEKKPSDPQPDDKSKGSEKNDKNSPSNKPNGEQGKEKSNGGKSKSGEKNEQKSNEKKPSEKEDKSKSGDSQPQDSPPNGGAKGGESGNEKSGEKSEGSENQGNGSGQSAGEKGGEKSSSQSSGGASGNESGGKGNSAGNSNSSDEQNAGGSPQEGAQPGNGNQSGSKSGAGANAQQPKQDGPKHDGEVIEETLRRMQEQGKAPPTAGAKSQPSSQDKSEEAKPSQIPGDAQNEGTSSKGQPAGEKSKAGQEGANPQNATPQNAGEQSKNSQKQNESSQGKAGTGGENSREKQGEQPGEKSKGGGQGNQSQQGAGEKSNTPSQGAPEAQGENRDTKKDAGQGGQEKSSEAGSPSQSQKQSNSQGSTAGDQSGGGKQGGGQSAKQPGHDAAGSQSAADDGAGAAQEAGRGETGKQGGGDQRANHATGAAGKEQGKGSSSKPGDKQGQPKPQPGGGKSGENPGQAKSQGPENTKGMNTGDPVTGGGAPGEGFAEGSGQHRKPQETEAENLEYAKQATNMALQHLKDQQNNPDPELLKRLGWTKEELNAFLQRWDELKRAAKEDKDARPELDEAYRSLGLRPANDARRTLEQRDDSARSLRDAGARSEPPSGYADQFRAFRKGAAKNK